MGGIIAAGILLLGVLGIIITIGAPVMTNELMKIYNSKKNVSNNSVHKNIIVFIGTLIISILSMMLLFLLLGYFIYRIIS